MDKNLKYLIFFIISITFLIKAYFVVINEGLWWDEAVYLQLGKNILKGCYSLECGKTIETFRPPLFPFVISPFSFDLTVARLANIIISIFSLISVYFLAKKLFSEDIALLSSLFVATNPLFIFFTGKVLTEGLFIIFISLSILFLFKKFKFNYLFSGVLAGLAFLTKWSGILFVSGCMIYFFFLLILNKKDKKINIYKNIFNFFVGFLISISPSLLISFLYYGDFYSIFIEYLRCLVFPASDLNSRVFYGLNELFKTFSLQIFFILCGILFLFIKIKKQKGIDLYVFLLILFLMPFSLFLSVSGSWSRILVSFLPIYSIVSSLFILNFKNLEWKISKNKVKMIRIKHINFLFILSCIISLLIGVNITFNDRFASKSLIEASRFVKELTDKNEIILSPSYPYIYYISDRICIKFPKYIENFENFISQLKENKVKYIVIYEYEVENPSYLKDFLSKLEFEDIKSFEEWGNKDATRIYKIKW